MKDMIAANELCEYYQIEISFFDTLKDVGLIEIASIENCYYLSFSELPKLEKLLRLHHDLNINIEGLEVVNNMLEKMEEMQLEIRQLKNKLSAFKY